MGAGLHRQATEQPLVVITGHDAVCKILLSGHHTRSKKTSAPNTALHVPPALGVGKNMTGGGGGGAVPRNLSSSKKSFGILSSRPPWEGRQHRFDIPSLTRIRE